MLNLRTIKQELQEYFKWSKPKDEGSCPLSSAKVMAKKCIAHIPEPYPDIIVISYIPCWMEVEGMRHMTEGRHVDDYTRTSWGGWNTRQNHVDNWKVTLNTSFSDTVCWLHFSLVIKWKANIFKKRKHFSFFPLTSLILMQFRDRSIATLQIENNSKFLSSFLERGQEIIRIPRSATTIALQTRHRTRIHHRT
jgi:hypothetical protein